MAFITSLRTNWEKSFSQILDKIRFISLKSPDSQTNDSIYHLGCLIFKRISVQKIDYVLIIRPTIRTLAVPLQRAGRDVGG